MLYLAMLFLLDASVLIEANRDYYPIGRVPQFWEWLLIRAKEGRLKMPIETYEEVAAGNDSLADWVKEHETELVLDAAASQELVAEVLERYAPDLTRSELRRIGKDAFLIAHALADRENICVVTTEMSRPSRRRGNRHIPDVCEELGIRCIHTFRLIRLLDFRIRAG